MYFLALLLAVPVQSTDPFQQSYKQGCISDYGVTDAAIECIAEDGTARIHPHNSLAEYCALSLGATCRRWLDNNGQATELSFSRINNFLQARLLTPNVDLSRLHELNSDLDTEMDELGHLMTQLDVCRTKCHCSPRSQRQVEHINLPTDPVFVSTYVMDYSRQSALPPSPLGPHGSRMPRFHPNQVSLRRWTPSENDVVLYSGPAGFHGSDTSETLVVRASLINAPECSLTPIPIFLQAALRSHSLPLYPNAQTLCAHPLFTGRTSPSMGGYCYRPPSSTRSPFARPQPAPISELYHLVFPPTTRSPAFSHCATITARTKYGSALGIAVQMYCRAVCDCGLFTLRSVGRGTTGKTATNDALEQVRAFLNRVWAEDSSDAETEDGASESGDQPANQELAQGWQHEWDSVTNRTKEEELERKLRDWLARAQAAEGLEPVEESGDGGNGQCSAASQCGIGEMCRALGREGRNLVGWCVGRKGRGGFLGLGVVGTRGQRSERGD